MLSELEPRLVDKAKSKCAEVFRVLGIDPGDWRENVLTGSTTATGSTANYDASITAELDKTGGYTVSLRRWNRADETPTVLMKGTFDEPENWATPDSYPKTDQYQDQESVSCAGNVQSAMLQAEALKRNAADQAAGYRKNRDSRPVHVVERATYQWDNSSPSERTVTREYDEPALT